MSDSLRKTAIIIGISLLLTMSGAVFLPGISGPWIFDDYTNIIQNTYAKVRSLDAVELKGAAYSLQAGPLNRPVAMITFAMNYYFAGSLVDTTPFKITNLLIHILNGLLVFWLSQLILQRYAQLHPKGFNSNPLKKSHNIILLAGVVSLLWLVHPIQITSVLYVVQRMTSLSALFTLVALILYLRGRLILLTGYKRKIWLLIAGIIVFWSLGMLSKENAALLPIYILTLELVLFSNEKPWSMWHYLEKRKKYYLLAGLVIAGFVFISLAIYYSLPGYSKRNFSMIERVMTESRVLFFYISLILVPRINQFSHQHDYIEISRSLIDPWTTLSSLIGILLLLGLAIAYRKKTALISLGILWFFAGHLLESTILPLEIAHEHRNYLATFGILLAMLGIAKLVIQLNPTARLIGVFFGIALILSSVTFLRASQWADYNSFYRYEAYHHPNSPRIQAGLGVLYEAQGKYEEATTVLRRAWELAPDDIGFMLSMYQLISKQGKELSEAENDDMSNRLASTTLTPTAYLAFENIAYCLQSTCRSLQKPMERWINVILNESTRPVDRSYYYYLLGVTLSSQGRIHEAIDVFRLSYESDPLYLHPLLNLAKIFIELKQLDVAERVLAELHKANKKTSHPRDREINELDAELQRAKKDISEASGANRHPATIPLRGAINQNL